MIVEAHGSRVYFLKCNLCKPIFFSGIFTIFASLALYVGNIYAGRALHDHLVNNILASPMMFFDTTPTGRILNRFSKDVDVLDTQIGRIYESWLSCLLRVISVPIVIGYSTPYFLIAFLPLAIIYIAVQVIINN